MHSGIEYTVSNLLIAVFWMISANLILDNKYPKVPTVIAEVIIQFVFWYLFEHVFTLFSALRFFVGLAVPVILLQVFHTDKPLFKLITGVLLFMTMVISEVILSVFIPYEMAMNGELFKLYAVPVYSIFVLVNLTVISLFTAVLIAYKRRYRGLVVEKQWFMFILFPASQVYSLFVWFNQYAAYGNYDTRKAIAMVVIDLLADAALLYTIRMTANNTELRIRSEMLEDQIHSQGNYYHHLASTYSDIRKMRHDIDNHIYAMEGLLDRGDFQDAKDYIHRLSEQDKTAVPFADCRNTVIASYLEKKREDIISEGIVFETDLHLPADLCISNPDLICIYGNILDNAIEACRNTENARIILKTAYDEPYLTISCSNTIPETSREKKRRIPELERGIGMTILAGLAEQYDGQYTYKSDERLFHTEIILKNKEPENRS